MILWVVCVCKIVNGGYFDVVGIIGKGKENVVPSSKKKPGFAKKTNKKGKFFRLLSSHFGMDV